MAKAYHRKIKFYWNRYLRKFGSNNEFRTSIKIHNTLTVAGHAQLTTALKEAKWVFTEFTKEYGKFTYYVNGY